MSTLVAQLATPAGTRRHQWWLVSAAIMIGTALIALWWVDPAEIAIPLCTLHATTGLQCPGCGATRATHELLHGRLIAAMHYNALWVLLLPVLIYAGTSHVRLILSGRPMPGDLSRRRWFWVTIVVLAMVFWVLRNS